MKFGKGSTDLIWQKGGKMKVTKSSLAHPPNANFRQFSTNCLQFKLIPVESINSRTAMEGK
jgi:hypothetical protein